MLLPVATLLAYVASDRRHVNHQRQRATALLQKLDTQLCTAIAVSADWGIICNWFLRLFDVAFHDIGKSRSEIDSMIETLDAVFLEGRIFKRSLHSDSGAPSEVSVAAEGPILRPHVAALGAFPPASITRKVMTYLQKNNV